MDTNNSLGRIFLLFRRNILTNSRNFLIAVGGVFGLVFFAYIIGSLSKMNTQEFHMAFFMIILIFGGMIYTSLAFNDFSLRSKGILFLTLPAKRSEKLLEAFIRTLIVYPLMVFVIYYLFSLFLDFLGMIIFGMPINIFNPFQGLDFQTLLAFMLIHSVFFLGAVVFDKNSFLKTVLTLFVVSTIITILSTLVGYLLFYDFETQLMTNYNFENFFSPMLEENLIKWGYLTEGLFTLFFWIVSYFRLTEKQI